MKKLQVKRIYQLALAACLLSFPIQGVYAKDLKQDGSIKVEKADEKEYPEMAKVTLQDAISAATKQVPGKVIEAELDTEEGFLVYEVKIMTPDKKVTEVLVDAGNSSILSMEKEG